jgi:hypothetical protein
MPMSFSKPTAYHSDKAKDERARCEPPHFLKGHFHVSNQNEVI